VCASPHQPARGITGVEVIAGFESVQNLQSDAEHQEKEKSRPSHEQMPSGDTIQRGVSRLVRAVGQAGHSLIVTGRLSRCCSSD
jgi:hypothetical protein